MALIPILCVKAKIQLKKKSISPCSLKLLLLLFHRRTLAQSNVLSGCRHNSAVDKKSGVPHSAREADIYAADSARDGRTPAATCGESAETHIFCRPGYIQVRTTFKLANT